MKKLEPLECSSASATGELEYSLNIAGIYQDMVTREWAVQASGNATQLAGAESLQLKWYDVDSLSDINVFMDAVRTALAADVIMISVHAADELPLNLYAWVAAWLPRRLFRAGALTALVGVVESQDIHSLRTVEYLQAVARRARLDFVPQERRRPITPQLLRSSE